MNDKWNIYKVTPADNVKLAEMELNIERLHHKAATPGGKSMLEDVQSLIERIKADEKKIQQLEKMNGITWLGDEQKTHPGPDAIPPDIKDDTGGEGIPWERGHKTAAELYKDRDAWPIPCNVAGGGFVQQAYWQGREDGAREMEKEIYGNGEGNPWEVKPST
jgi:hypothetical protein